MIEKILKELAFDGVKHLQLSGFVPNTVGNFLYPSLPFEQLYRYQVDVVRAIEHSNVFISAPTGSGKTLAFALAYARLREKMPDATMLVLYPRKSLARDQIKSLYYIFEHIPHMKDIKVMPYDGDVSAVSKREALIGADVILSNFYGIHLYLANHGSWARFLSNLAVIVIDEAHVYTGVFGTHVAYVVRRLLRLSHVYGASPKIIMASATVIDPKDSAHLLVGKSFEVIEVGNVSLYPKDLYFLSISSSQGKKKLVELLGYFIDYGYRGMVFFNSREELERLYYELSRSQYKDEVLPYRAGYDVDTRRAIEVKMREGDISFLLATSAMELGIDIGDIDVVIMYGFPTSGFSSFWQRAGRAGRKEKGYIVSFLKENNALDMYVYDHPEIVLEKRGDFLYIDEENPEISYKQMRCASWEYPLDIDRDKDFFKESILMKFMEDNKSKLLPTSRGIVLIDEKPHSEVSLNEGDSLVFRIVDVDSGKIMEKVEMWRVFKKHYPGSNYLFMGQSYLVKFVDLEKHVVGVEKTKNLRETIPVGWEDIEVIKVITKKRVGNAWVYLGKLDIQSYTIGYSSNRGIYLFNAPLYRSFQTKGVWFDVKREDLVVTNNLFSLHIPSLGIENVTLDEVFAGALHALEHVLINVLSLISISPDDVGGYSIPSIYRHIVGEFSKSSLIYVDTDRRSFPRVSLDIKRSARVYIYDGHTGGIGIAEKMFNKWEEVVGYAARRLDECGCEKGCPACVMSHSCGNGNRPLNKLGSRSLLSNIFLV